MKAFTLAILLSLFSSSAFAWTCGSTPVKWVHTQEAKESPYFDGRSIFLDSRFFRHHSNLFARFVFLHECGHARGYDSEFGADAYASRHIHTSHKRALRAQLCRDLKNYDRNGYARCSRIRKELR